MGQGRGSGPHHTLHSTTPSINSTMTEDPILACLTCSFNFTYVEISFSGCFRFTSQPRGLCDGACSCVYPLSVPGNSECLTTYFSLLLVGGLLGHCSHAGTMRLFRGCQEVLVQAGRSPTDPPLSRSVTKPLCPSTAACATRASGTGPWSPCCPCWPAASSTR